MEEEDEEEEESEEEENAAAKATSKATIGLLGGLFTLVSAYAFYKATR